MKSPASSIKINNKLQIFLPGNLLMEESNGMQQEYYFHHLHNLTKYILENKNLLNPVRRIRNILASWILIRKNMRIQGQNINSRILLLFKNQ